MNEFDQFTQPFAASELKFYPAATTDGPPRRGKIAPYADARAYMDRLDATLGHGGWSTKYVVLDPQSKAVECQLSVFLDGQWVVKSDVGYPNEAKDADNAGREPLKAAYSDALKRACTQLGVGRFLYSMEFEGGDWAEITPGQFPKFVKTPIPKRFTAPVRQAPAPQRPQAAQPAPQAPQPAPAAPEEPTEALPPPPDHEEVFRVPADLHVHEWGADADGELVCTWEGCSAVYEGPMDFAEQAGEFVSDNGESINLTKLTRFLSDQGMRLQDIAVIAPHPSGRAGVAGPDEWLRRNQERTLMDLVQLAREAKEAKQPQTAAPPARTNGRQAALPTR